METDLTSILDQQLRGLQAPEAVGWWPLAFGWWVLLALLLTAISAGIWFTYRKRQKSLYRRQATSELALICAQWQNDQDTAIYLQSVNSLLRRMLISTGDKNRNRSHVSKSGTEWIEILNHSSALSDELADALTHKLYQPNPVADIDSLNRELSTWIRSHKPRQSTRKRQGDSTNEVPTHA